MNIFKKYKITYTCFFAVIFVIIYIFTITRVTLQNDTLFDIKLGEKYLTNGITLIDTFSIHENLEYICHHFMVSVIIYLIYRYFNFIGLYVLEIVLCCILAFTLYLANKLFIKSKHLRFFFVIFELTMFIPYISVRAQMFSYIFFVLEIIFIEKFLREKRKKYLIPLSLLPFFIINFHAGVIPVYYIILLVYMTNIFKININDKIVNVTEYKKNVLWLFIPMLIGSLLMFINPFGIKNITYFIYTIFGTSQSSEFDPSSLSNNFLFFIYLFILIISFLISKSKITIHQLLFFLGGSLMALLSVRHFSIFIILVITCSNIIEDICNITFNWFCLSQDDIKKSKSVFAICTYSIFFVLYISSLVSINKKIEFLPEDDYPITAVKFIKENIDEDKKIFNFYNWGSLLMFNDIKVFIDSRCDLYTPSYNERCTVYTDHNNLMLLNSDYKSIIQKYDIDYLFIPIDKPIYYVICDNDNFKQIYKDNVSCIFEVIK